MTALERVTQNGRVLVYVKEQTPEICLAAVNQNGWALNCVDDKFFNECAKHVYGSRSSTIPIL